MSIASDLMGTIKSHGISILSHWPAQRFRSLGLLQVLHVRDTVFQSPVFSGLLSLPVQRKEMRANDTRMVLAASFVISPGV